MEGQDGVGVWVKGVEVVAYTRENRGRSGAVCGTFGIARRSTKIIKRIEKRKRILNKRKSSVWDCGLCSKGGYDFFF